MNAVIFDGREAVDLGEVDPSEVEAVLGLIPDVWVHRGALYPSLHRVTFSIDAGVKRDKLGRAVGRKVIRRTIAQGPRGLSAVFFKTQGGPAYLLPERKQTLAAWVRGEMQARYVPGTTKYRLVA